MMSPSVTRMPMKSPLFPVTLAFCTGILASTYVQTPLPHLLAASAACLLALWVAHLCCRAWLVFLLSLVCFASLGLVCPAIHQGSYASQHLRILTRSGKLDLNE